METLALPLPSAMREGRSRMSGLCMIVFLMPLNCPNSAITLSRLSIVRTMLTKTLPVQLPIYDHADELGVSASGYSLWGGSAGARMAAVLGNAGFLRQLTGRKDIPQAAAVIMQYTGYNTVSQQDAATYACVGTNDGIASWRTMQRRLQSLSALGIPTEFHAYDGLPHGFGLGTGTVAEGWIADAVRFWDAQIDN